MQNPRVACGARAAALFLAAIICAANSAFALTARGPDGAGGSLEPLTDQGQNWYPFDRLCQLFTLRGSFDPVTTLGQTVAGQKKLTVMPGLPWAIIDGQPAPLGIAPRLENGQLLVPESIIPMGIGPLLTGFTWDPAARRATFSGVGVRPAGPQRALPVVLLLPGHSKDDPGLAAADGESEARAAQRYSEELAQALNVRGKFAAKLARPVSGDEADPRLLAAQAWQVNAALLLAVHCHQDAGRHRLTVIRQQADPFAAKIQDYPSPALAEVIPWGAKLTGAEDAARRLADTVSRAWRAAFPDGAVRMFRAPVRLLLDMPCPALFIELPLSADADERQRYVEILATAVGDALAEESRR